MLFYDTKKWNALDQGCATFSAAEPNMQKQNYNQNNHKFLGPFCQNFFDNFSIYDPTTCGYYYLRICLIFTQILCENLFCLVLYQIYEVENEVEKIDPTLIKGLHIKIV